jgi:RNA polymerase sigma-70 factor (ECF subfamily)
MDKRCVSGRADSERQTFERELIGYLPLLLRVAKRFTHSKDAADDLVQDTVYLALRGYTSFTPGTNLKAWLCNIMRNFWISHRRRAWRSVPWDDKFFDEMTTDGQLPAQEAALELDDTLALLRHLPQQRASVLIMAGLGYNTQEIAKVHQCALGTVRSGAKRGRVALIALST